MPDMRATVSISAPARAVAEEVQHRFHISEVMEVVRFGAAVAIAHGLDPSQGRTPGAPNGTWNLGSLDRSGQLRALVQAMYPDSGPDPAIPLEALMDRGLILLGDLIKQNDDTTLVSLVEQARAVSA